MAKKTKDSNLSVEERLEQALIPNWDEPYKLPENWCWVKLSTVCSLENGEKSTEKDLVYLDAKTLRGITEPKTRDSGIVVNKDQKVILVDGENSGEVFVVPYRGYMGSTFKIINIAANADEMYIRYFIDQNRERLRNSKVGSAIPHLNKDLFFDLKLPFPPLCEQKRIVSHIETLFAKLDEAKEKAQEVVDGFETRKAAILHKAFSGELTAKWREENNISFKSWENRPLSQIATVVSGFAFSSSDFNSQNTVPCIKITNVGVGEYLSDEYEFLPEAYLNEYEKFIVNKGNILISLTRSYINAGLKVCISEETKSSLLNQRVAMIKNCNIRYIYYFLRSDKVLSYVKEKSKTTNQPNLSIKDLNNLTVPMACPEEQFEIVRIVDNLISKEQQAKETAETVIEQIDTMKKAILARAFHGELGTNDPDEENAVELLKKVLDGDAAVQTPAKKPTKRISIPSDIKELLSNTREEEIIKLLLKSAPQPVSIQEIMSLSSKKFELMDALRSLEKKQLITKNESGEYSLTR